MKDVYYHVIYRLLYPVVNILLRKGIAFGEFSQVVKRVYTDVAEQVLLESEGKATSARISIMTGLTRKDVGLLRKATNESDVTNHISQKYNRSVRVISGWLEDKEFCSDAGYPRTLEIHGKSGSFESLVNHYSGDMPVRAMLDELERVGVLEKIGDHHVSLLRHAYIPEGDEDDKLMILGEDVSLLVSTIDHNLTTNNNESFFQRKVCYNNLPEDRLGEFKAIVDKDGQHLLEKFNEWLCLHDRDRTTISKGTGRMKAGVGIYYFEENLADNEKTLEQSTKVKTDGNSKQTSKNKSRK